MITVPPVHDFWGGGGGGVGCLALDTSGTENDPPPKKVQRRFWGRRGYFSLLTFVERESVRRESCFRMCGDLVLERGRCNPQPCRCHRGTGNATRKKLGKRGGLLTANAFLLRALVNPTAPRPARFAPRR